MRVAGQRHAPAALPPGKIRDPLYRVSRDISADIATRYVLDGPGFESQWGVRFSARVQTALEHTQPPIQWVPGLSRG